MDSEMPRDEGNPSVEEPPVLQGNTTDVVVRPRARTASVAWRNRALAVRAAVPQLVRNPVVVGASAAVATVAVRMAVDVALRAVTGSSSPRPVALTVTGSVVHEVHVVRHVHVVQHVVHHVVQRGPEPVAIWLAPPRG